MTSLERYLATLDGRPVDHLARVPILMQFAAEHIGSNYAAFASDHRVLTAANLACARDFGIDQVSTISDPYRETQAFGARIIYEPNRVPRCETHPLESDPDLSRLAKPDPQVSERMRDRIEAIRSYRHQAGGLCSILGWVEGPASGAATLRRMDNFFIDLMEDEAYAGELMDLCTEVALAFARAQIEEGADTIGIGDAAASQVSPDVYERLIQPREQRLVRGIGRLGAKVRLHICGDITHLLPGISALGIDILDVDHMVDPGIVRKAVGPRTTLVGNLDPVAAVLRSTPDRIRREIRESHLKAGNPFMVGAGCEIPSLTPADNLKALCEPVPYAA